MLTDTLLTKGRYSLIATPRAIKPALDCHDEMPIKRLWPEIVRLVALGTRHCRPPISLAETGGESTPR
jgi:hypothetical protein